MGARSASAGLATIALLALAPAARAGPVGHCCTALPPGSPGVLLTDLAAGATLDVGALHLHDFQILPTVPPPLDISRVEVFGLDDDPERPGLRFESNGTFGVFGITGQETFGLAYRVSVLPSGPLIEGAEMGYDFFLSCPLGCPLAVIGVAFELSPTGAPGSAFIGNTGPAMGAFDVLFDDPANPTPFEPTSDLDVTLDFGVAVALEDGTLEMTRLETRYYLPEPSGTPMLGAGLLGLVAASRRARHRRSRPR
jgi:hypothetical protein